ncbi:hypothetical protein [Streptomyces sp. NPDC056817]|uniref:Mu transposase domain-containing protein n=1 Tax=Streptomyces sp. NPDC056817 TaxID=3345950 RepID=UPI0036B5A805
MLALPPVAPPNWWPLHTRLGRDHYIRVDTCDYSVHPRAIGRQITVRADTEEVVATTRAGETVAHHSRCWARHQTITDPEHAAAAEMLRGQAIRQRASHARARGLAGLAPDDLGVEVEQRQLGSYDRIFTLIEGGAAKEDT